MLMFFVMASMHRMSLYMFPMFFIIPAAYVMAKRSRTIRHRLAVTHEGRLSGIKDRLKWGRRASWMIGLAMLSILAFEIYYISTSGREFFAQQQVQSEATTRIWIRYRTGITADMRAVLGSRVFSLVAPPIDWRDRHEFLQLMCSEGVLDG